MTDLFTIDVSGAREAKVGARGITSVELDELVPRGRQVHDDLLLARARGQVGFADLYMLGREAMRARDAAESLASRFEDVVIFTSGAEADVLAALLDGITHPYHNLLPASGRAGRPRVIVIDSTDPDHLVAFLESFALEQALAICIAKDGNGAGALLQFSIVRDLLRMRVGPGYQDHLVVVTDPGGGALREEALRDGFLSFEIPRNVRARFALLTPVALLPGALAGADVRGVLSGAHAAAEQTAGEDLRSNPAYLLAAVLHLLRTAHGCGHQVVVAATPSLSGTARQMARLFQETLGQTESGGSHLATSSADLPRDMDWLVRRCTTGAADTGVIVLDAEKRSRDRVLPKAVAGSLDLAGKQVSDVSSAQSSATLLMLEKADVPVVRISLPAVTANAFGALHMAAMLSASFGAGLAGIESGTDAGHAALQQAVGDALSEL